MMRCLAIDDEPLALELLEDNISKVPYLQLVAGCSNPLEAMKVMQAEPVDLIFLDIQMPGITGIQFIQGMANKPMVIFITAYEKYALESYNLDVIDYLVKPVSLERFLKACNKANDLFQLKTNKPAADKETAEYFFVNADYSLIKIAIDDIVWVEGLKDYVKIHLKSTTKPVVTRIPMKNIEDNLPSSKFIRIHKSYIIAIRQITSLRRSSVFLGSLELPIGESYKSAITDLTNKYNL